MEITKNNNRKAFGEFLHQVGVGLGFIIKFSAKVILFVTRFLIFLLNLTLHLVSDLLEKCILSNWRWYIRYCNSKREKMYQIQVVSNGTKHEYIMNRGKEYDKLYKDLKSQVDVTERGTTMILDLELSKDIIAKIDRIVYLVERNAIKEAYKFGKMSKYDIEDEDDIYAEFIKDNVKKGK